MKILMVEDDVELAKSTAFIIERLGSHQVTTTIEPEEIFQQCAGGTIRLVIMDIHLPGARWQGQRVDGKDLVRLLKARWQTLPILIVTAYVTPDQQPRLLAECGADSCYTKPIVDYDTFLNLVARLGGSP